MTRIETRLAAAGLMMLCGTASATESAPVFSDQDVSVSGGIGLLNIDASEFVYDGDYKLSQLDWESRGIVLFSLEAEAELQGDYLLKANFGVGGLGDGFMTDYDWLSNGPNGMDDWTDRSRHPDTGLQHYAAGSLELYRRLWADDDRSLKIGGGLKYTDVKWTANGGSYIYSRPGYRDTTGTFNDDERVISYRMQMPLTYASVAATQNIDRWSLGGTLKAGLSLGINDIDDHWLKSNRFYDRMNPAPMIGVDVTANYAVTDDFSIYLGGSFEKIFEAGGSMEVVHTKTGATTNIDGGAGANYQSVNLTFGIKRQF